MTPPSVTADSTAVLRTRAVQLARPQGEEQEAASTDLLMAVVGGRQVAVDLGAVAEVRPPGAVAEVPGSSAALVGLVGGRGEALAVASLSTLLGLTTSTPPHEQWVVVLDDPAAPLGLLVDTVQEIVRVDDEELVSAAEAQGVVGALTPQGALVLDAQALLRDPRVSLHPNDAEEPSWRER